MKQVYNLLFTLIFLMAPFIGKSTHIVGGSITYEHLGGATYRVTFKMYRDCGPGHANFPNNVRIEVRDQNGNSFSPDKDIIIPLTQTQVLNPPIDTCAFDPGICVEEAIYSKIVNNLPPQSGGYHLYFGYCCRNWSITNVPVTPGQTGASYYTYIPDNNSLLTNSSPQWKNFPPVFVCQGNPLTFDHGATDKDGDSLVYSFYHPFEDNNPSWPGPNFQNVPYNAGYTWNDPLGGSSLTINPATGVITGVPPALGQFVLGVKVDEYRNGVLINTVYRDFQFNIINCPPLPFPGIGPMEGCSGTAVNFTNTSTPLVGNSFYWDFGDLSSTSDTSNATNPSYTYPSIGTYVVMLVAQAGTPCADTTYDTLTVSGITPDFTTLDSVCINNPVNFFDNSVPTANATTNSWNWNFGDGGSAVIPNPTYNYTTSGLQTVQLIVTTNTGCTDSISKDIYVHALPQAFATDTFACMSNPVTNLNGNVSGASGGLWIGSGGFNPNNTDLNASYTPTAGELSAGYATLILSTTGNGLCPASSDTMTLSFTTGITADAGNDIFVCKDTASVPLAGTIITASGGQWSSSGTGTFQPNPFDLNASYIPSNADTTAGTVSIFLNSIGNGNCMPDADTLIVTFTNTPVVTILSNDTACSGSAFIPVDATSTTGTGYWQTLGSGYFSPNDSLTSNSYYIDSLDNVNGNVTLVFMSTNNGGCQSHADSMTIELIPSPTANFSYTSACLNDTLFLTDSSTFVDPIVSWEWDFGNGLTDSVQNTSTVYDTSGFIGVDLIVTSVNGCVDTITKDVYVQPQPLAIAVDTFACLSNPVTNLNGSVVGASGGFWTGNGSFNPDTTDLNAAYTPTATELTNGFSTIILTTTGNGLCPSGSDTMIVNYNIGITVDAGIDLLVCKDSSAIPLSGIVTTASGGQWVTNGTGTFTPDEFDLNADYIPSAADTANGSVMIYLNSVGNGNCVPQTDSMIISFLSPPNTTILSNDTACAGSGSIPVDANSTTGSGYWQTLGSGYFSPNDSLNSSNYYIDSLDNVNGNVTLLFTSTNNSVCQSFTDTLYINLIPSPTANFSYVSACINDTVFLNDSSTFIDPITSWFWDFGNGLTDTNSNTSTVFDTSGFLNVDLVVTSLNGCVDTITKGVYVQPLPQVIATDTFDCSANPAVNLNGGVVGASGGLWSGGGTFNPSTTDLNALYTPTVGETTVGYATLVLTTTGNGLCPAVSDTMTLSFPPGITADAGNDIFACKDTGSVPLSGVIVTASGGQWITNGTGTFLPNEFDLNAEYLPSAADTTAGNVAIYLNSIGNGNCVPDSDTLLITFTEIPSVTILSDTVACAGNIFIPINANSSTGNGYWQTLGSGYFSPNDSLISTSYFADSSDNANGNVTLLFMSTNNGGCQSSADTLNLVLIPAPAADFSFTSVCPDETVNFNDLTTSVDSVVSWQWDFGNGLNDNLANTSTVYDTAGVYNTSLIVASTNGCSDTIVQPVLIYSIPVADFVTNSICQGANSLFNDASIVNGSSIVNWLWNFGDGGVDSIQNPIYSYSNGGSYTVSLIVGSAQNCYDTTSNIITVQPSPTAGFSSSPGSVQVNENFNFTDLSFVNIISWQWDFGDALGTSNLQNPSYNYDVAGNYNVCLMVTDVMGCDDSICEEVIVFMPPVVPNAFSPNGTGENNIFSVLGGPYKELEFKIYNNWGELIFESNQQSEGWDGTRDGIDQPIGVYIYTVRAVTLDDQQYKINGDVTLLR